MIRISAINGSPKAADSTSGLLAEQLAKLLGTNIKEVRARDLARLADPAPELGMLLAGDVLLVVFPMYVDALPAPLLRSLTLIEQAAAERAEQGWSLPQVYTIVNCGFYEAGQTRLALQIVEHFALRSGLQWGYGLGVGGGGMLLSQSKSFGKGPTAKVYAALREMAEAMLSGSSGSQNQFVSPSFPRALYQISGNLEWNLAARRNGVSKLLQAQPHLQD